MRVTFAIPTSRAALAGLAALWLSPAFAQAPAGTIPGAVAPAPAIVLPAPPPVPATPVVVPQAAAPAAAVAAPAVAVPGAPAAPAAVAVAKPKPKRVAPPPPPREMQIPDDPVPSFQPDTFFSTAKASEKYAAIADSGGWPRIAAALAPGAKGKAVAVLRQRLAIEEDIDAAGGDGEAWDGTLTAAVKHFQMRNGLRQNGLVAGATLKAMNVPASVRFRQLASSAQRLAGLNFNFAERYVVVNIPSAAVEAVENGRVAHHYIAVVGDVEHRSPEVEAKISAVNLNPTWTVPTSIIKNEIIPKMRKDPGYLARAKIRMLDNAGAEVSPASINWSGERAVNYTLRQDSGAGNSLGAIRIQMTNKHSVYMHDTPSKRLFGADYRFLSHGCVRVQGVYDLAAWLLEGTGGAPAGAWNREALLAKVAGAAREDLKLAKSVPVIWVYMTGWASTDGTAHFRDDVYGVDGVGDVAQADAPAAR